MRINRETNLGKLSPRHCLKTVAERLSVNVLVQYWYVISRQLLQNFCKLYDELSVAIPVMNCKRFPVLGKRWSSSTL